MRTTLRCPKCDSRKIYEMAPFAIPEWQYSNSVKPFPVVTRPGTIQLLPGETEIPDRRVAGTFEVWLCSSCGYTEWYAQQTRGLAELLAGLARIQSSGVRFHDGDAAPAPYR